MLKILFLAANPVTASSLDLEQEIRAIERELQTVKFRDQISFVVRQAVQADDLVRLLARVRALQDFVETQEGGDLLTAYKRAANILKKEKWEGGPPSAPRREDVKPEEHALASALETAEPQALSAVQAEDFTGAMAALATLRQPIDAFFDHVTVNVDDLGTRAERLNLLMRFRDAVDRVADFSRIEG